MLSTASIPLFGFIFKSPTLNGQLSCLLPRLSTLAQNIPAPSSPSFDLEAQKYAEVGITEFVGSQPKIIATVKEKCADFQVHEIDMYGKKVQLTDLGPPRDYNLGSKKGRTKKYIHCTLYKEGIEQSVAANYIAKHLKVKAEDIYFAGRKDKISQSTQRISFITHRSAHDIVNLSASWKMTRLGNYSYSSRSLKFGKMNGNHFKILVRNIKVPTSSSSSPHDVVSEIHNGMKTLKEIGFINYWGLQKFGSNCHQVGNAVLKLDWPKAIDLILTEKPNDWPHMAKAKSCWLRERDPVKCLEFFPKDQREIDFRAGLFKSLIKQKGKGDLIEIFQGLPKSARALFIPAMTSYLWNQLVNIRIKNFGFQVLPGDYVEIPNPNSSFENSWIGSSSSSSSQANSNNVAHGDRTLKILGDSDLVPGHPYSIYDVLLPVLGTKLTKYSNPSIQILQEQLLAKEGLNHDSLVKFPIKEEVPRGFYRPIIVRPEGINYQIYPYNDTDNLNSLMPSDLYFLQQEEKLEDSQQFNGYSETGVKDKICAIVEFTLPNSCYATMALREIAQTDNFTPP